MSAKVGLMWLRRDLRLRDNAALARAIAECDEVIPVFVFDIDILRALTSTPWDARVAFIHQSVAEVKLAIQEYHKGDLLVRYGKPLEEIPNLVKQFNVTSVYANRDYEPTAVERDNKMQAALGSHVPLKLFKDHVIFEGNEVNKASAGSTGGYQIFTPYFTVWRSQLRGTDGALHHAEHDSTSKLSSTLRKVPPPKREPLISLSEMGFLDSPVVMQPTTANAVAQNVLGDKITPIAPGESGAQAALRAFKDRIDRYDTDRDVPSIQGTSRLSVHLRFGTISTRQVVRTILDKAWPQGKGMEVFLSELAWRDFYQQKYAQYVQPTGCAHMWETPHTLFTAEICDIIGIDKKFIPPTAHHQLAKPLTPELQKFNAWCTGTTGYAIVDAAIRELLTTGYMHNRMRMLVSSFLVKILQIDWRWGERFFAHHLLDYDYGANMGGWQWSASIGAGTQPSFQVFNPMTQSKKFDAKGEYILKYVPSLAGVAPVSKLHDVNPTTAYPKPIVDYSTARAQWMAKIKVGGATSPSTLAVGTKRGRSPSSAK